MITEEYKSGNTTIKVCDDYCKDKTPKDVDSILQKLAVTLQGSLVSEKKRPPN